MRREGHLREHVWMKGRRWDTLLYAILAHEWRDTAQRPTLSPHPPALLR
jgi:RimJ/RimL family protein N-acetyltransferase